MEHIYDMLIIGGGPSGCTAALYAARAGLDTLLIEKIAAGGQMTYTDKIENYPGFDEGIGGIELGIKMQKGAERFGAKTVYAEVKAADFSDKIKKAVTSTGDFYGKTAVIATGADPRELGIAGERELTGRGIHYCAHCDGRFYKDKTVAVVGGGNSAVSDALYLSKLAAKVYVIYRSDSLKAEKIYDEPLKAAENVELIPNSAVAGFIAKDKFQGVTVKNLNDETEYELFCGGVFVGIGRKPASEFLGNSVAADKNGYIIADETTRTNVSGVFAAGDVRTKPLRQIITAASDGATAVHFAKKYLSSAE